MNRRRRWRRPSSTPELTASDLHIVSAALTVYSVELERRIGTDPAPVYRVHDKIVALIRAGRP